MENLEKQKQNHRSRKKHSLAVEATSSGNGLLHSKVATRSKSTNDIELNSVTEGLLELEIKGMRMETEHQLPEALLTDILSRIPAKSLIRWKSVSKHWYSLIQNPNFIALHHSRAQPNEIVTLARSDTNQVAQALIASPTAFRDLNLRFTGRAAFGLTETCNGLLCLQNASEIVICNPAVKEFRALPSLFHQTERSCFVGFTFDPKANDYKAVKFVTRNCTPCDLLKFPRTAMQSFFHNHDSECNCIRPVCFPNVYVYAMSTDSWRETDAVVPDYCIYHVRQCYRCTSSDGVFYWLAHDHNADFMHICVFRTSEELFESISLPANFRLKSLSNLCFLKDSLTLVLSDSFGHGTPVETCFDIWVMDKYGVQESWTKKYSTGPLLGCHNPLGFRANAEDLLTRLDHKRMVAYDLSTHKLVEYDPLGDMPDSYLVDEVFHYAESLVQVKRLTLKNKKFSSKKKKSFSKKKKTTSKKNH